MNTLEFYGYPWRIKEDSPRTPVEIRGWSALMDNRGCTLAYLNPMLKTPILGTLDLLQAVSDCIRVYDDAVQRGYIPKDAYNNLKGIRQLHAKMSETN